MRMNESCESFSQVGVSQRAQLEESIDLVLSNVETK